MLDTKGATGDSFDIITKFFKDNQIIFEGEIIEGKTYTAGIQKIGLKLLGSEPALIGGHSYIKIPATGFAIREGEWQRIAIIKTNNESIGIIIATMSI